MYISKKEKAIRNIEKWEKYSPYMEMANCCKNNAHLVIKYPKVDKTKVFDKCVLTIRNESIDKCVLSSNERYGNERTCVICPVEYDKLGTSYLKGENTIETKLCKCSCLYNVMTSYMAFYCDDDNFHHDGFLNKWEYVYCKDVIFFKEINEYVNCDVAIVQYPSKNILENMKYSKKDMEEIYLNSIISIYQTAKYNGAESIIVNDLGHYGNAMSVEWCANVWISTLLGIEPKLYKRIQFAIEDKHTYEIFRDRFYEVGLWRVL